MAGHPHSSKQISQEKKVREQRGAQGTAPCVSDGCTRNLGIGVPGGELHVEWGETWTWAEFNLYDIMSKMYFEIMEW